MVLMSNGDPETLPGGNKALWAENVDYTKQGALCLDCGYMLRELQIDRCPECGREFNRHDRHSMKIPGRKRARTIAPIIPFSEQIVLASLLATVYWIIAI